MREAAIDPPRQAPRSGTGRRPAGAAPRGGSSSAAIAAQRLGGGRRTATPETPPRLLSVLVRQASRIRPVKAAAIGVFSLMLVGIVANAVLFQKSRHPAPLLGSTAGHAAPQPEASSKASAVAPAPAPRAVTATAPQSPAAPQAAPEASAAAKPAPAKRATAHPQHDDGIGRLLQKDASTETAAPLEKKPNAALLATQRHLVKLGYAVKPDGVMSAATRDAVEKFERDRHLKAGAAITPALRREIAAAASPEAPAKVQ